MNNFLMRSAWALVAVLLGFLILQFNGLEPWDRGDNDADHVAINDTLPEALVSSILRDARGAMRNDRRPCTLALFFNSTCAACERVAPAWRNVGYVRTTHTVLPAVWLGRHSDEGAIEWIERHGIPMSKRLNDDEWSSLDVRLVPSYYVIDGANRMRMMGVVNPRGIAALNDQSEGILRSCE